MPNALRIAFKAGSPSAAFTIYAEHGRYTLNGRSAGFSKTDETPLTDTWAKVSTDFSRYDVRAGPWSLNQGWWSACLIRATGDIFLAQGNPSVTFGSGAFHGTFFYRSSLGYWERTNSVAATVADTNGWWRNITLGSIKENYAIAHDSSRDIVVIAGRGVPPGEDTDAATAGYQGPHIGEMYYVVAQDEYFVRYPESGNTWVPTTADDRDHYWIDNIGTGLEGWTSVWEYDAPTDRIYVQGGWSGQSVGLQYRSMATGVKATVISGVTYPRNNGPAMLSNRRGGLDHSTRQMWALAANAELYVLSLNDLTPSWKLIPTAGVKPSVSPPAAYPSSADTSWGLMAALHEPHQQIVAYVGDNEIVTADAGSSIRKAWVLDLHTLTWRAGVWPDTGTVPADSVCSVMAQMFYNPANKRVRLLTSDAALSRGMVYDYYPAPDSSSNWETFALPARTTANWGSQTLPFAVGGECKHVEMAYCPDNNRIYAFGGDAPSSNTIHIHSMDVDTGEWRLDAGFNPNLYTENTWPYPFPNGFQDECLFQWVPSLGKFMIGFCGGESYTTEGTLAGNYTKGVWFYDPTEPPATSMTQDLRLFNSFEYGDENPGIRSPSYDAATHRVYRLSQDGGSLQRWDIATMTKMTTVVLGYSWYGGGTLSFRNAQIVLNGYLYAMGQQYNVEGSPRVFFARVNLATNEVQRLTAPPYGATGMPSAAARYNAELGFHLVSSSNKIIFPYSFEPQGYVHGLFIYDTTSGLWTRDVNLPAVGTFLANSFVSLDDGRIGMAGSAFATPRQSHFYLYTLPQ